MVLIDPESAVSVCAGGVFAAGFVAGAGVVVAGAVVEVDESWA
jgi:hypothetical protein